MRNLSSGVFDKLNCGYREKYGWIAFGQAAPANVERTAGHMVWVALIFEFSVKYMYFLRKSEILVRFLRPNLAFSVAIFFLGISRKIQF